jgi:GntR family transcriptional regulator/MocR family aminotransferase
MPLPPQFAPDVPYDFRAGLPDARLFPYAAWRRLLSAELRGDGGELGVPCPPAGHPGLRSAIARHIGVSRNVQAGADDIVVTCGIQQAMDLAARVLLEPGACVALEEPGYIPPRLLFESLGARVVGVPVDDEGLIVDALPDRTRLVYVTPSHQFPLGMAMSMSRRLALLDWAEEHDAAILEDDYDSEFRYTDQPLEPLHSLDRYARVLYLGSFSKVLLPTLRLGFVVAPAPLSHALNAAKFVSDWHTHLPLQAALARFIDDGSFARHIRRMRAAYRIRHERVVAALRGPMSAWLDLIPSAAGLHVSARVRPGTSLDTAALRARATERGVEILDFSQCATGSKDRPGVLVGYGAIPTNRVDEGLRRLHGCLADA